MYITGFHNFTKFTLRRLYSVSRSGKLGTTVKTMEKILSPSERLTSSVQPLNYKILLEPDLETGKKFIGNVVIKVNVTETKHDICLHANLLEIREVKLFKDDQTAVPVARFKLVPKVEQLQVVLADPIDKGTYNINVDFKGDLTGFIGFYAAYTKDDR